MCFGVSVLSVVFRLQILNMHKNLERMTADSVGMVSSGTRAFNILYLSGLSGVCKKCCTHLLRKDEHKSPI